MESDSRDGGLGALVRAAVAAVPRPFRRVAVASVASDERLAALTSTLADEGLRAPLVNPSSGLHLALERPETCGFDRQYAARAALGRQAGPCVVVDAGTALTVDAVVPAGHPSARALEAIGGTAPVDVAGVFLGGAIAPGPRMLAEALGRGGARLWEVDLSPDAPALGRSSDEAMRSGVVVGHAGAAVHLARAVARGAGLGELDRATPVWLTGGAAPFVRYALEEAFGSELHVATGLVLEGLAAAIGGTGSDRERGWAEGVL